jgi:hypothetical protein
MKLRDGPGRSCLGSQNDFFISAIVNIAFRGLL